MFPPPFATALYLFAAWMKFCTTVYPLNALLSSEQFADSIFFLLRIRILNTVRFLQNLHQQNRILFPAVAIVFSGTSTPTEFSECCSINLSSSCFFFYNSLSTWWKETNNLTDQGCEILPERRMPYENQTIRRLNFVVLNSMITYKNTSTHTYSRTYAYTHTHNLLSCLCNTGSLQYHISTYIGLPCHLTPHTPFYYYYYTITIISLFSNSFLWFCPYSSAASNKRCVVPSLTNFFHCFWLQTYTVLSTRLPKCVTETMIRDEIPRKEK